MQVCIPALFVQFMLHAVEWNHYVRAATKLMHSHFGSLIAVFFFTSSSLNSLSTFEIVRSQAGRQCTFHAILRRFCVSIEPGKSNKYNIFCVCVCVALVIQHAKRIRSVVICGLSGFTILFHINGGIFEKKLLNIKCVLILSKIFS
jgi:TRAP-type uncharacterized transport system fused permease subunit